MSLENEQVEHTKTVLTAITIGISATIYLLCRRRIFEKYPIFAKVISVAWSIVFYWSQLTKNIFSLSLSTSEQSIFEEEFKYLIVTSSLFNETSQQQQQPKHRQLDSRTETTSEDIKDEEEFFVNSNKSLAIRIFGTSTLGVIISILILTKFNIVSPVLLPCWLSVYATTCYILYKHHRHVQIRRIHASALDSMQKIVSLSQKSDSILIRLINNFHGTSNDSFKEQQQTFGTYLSGHFETYTELVHQLQPLIDTSNLSTLREMYNVKEDIPSLLLEFDSHQYEMDDIDLIYSVTCWKRREYLLYLLALDVMSNNRKNTHYGQNWRQAIKVNKSLLREYDQFNKKLVGLERAVTEKKKSTEIEEASTKDINLSTSSSSSLLSTSAPENPSSFTLSDKRSSNLMLRVSTVEKYMEDIQAQLFLCKQDTKSISSGRVSTLSLERMSKRFNHIDESFTNLLTQWEESKSALNTLIESEQSKFGSMPLLPSPPSSPRNQQSFDDDANSLNSNIMTNTREPYQLNRSRSYNGNSIDNTHRSSFTNNRLQRIQSLKISNNNRNIVKEPLLSPINTTITNNDTPM